MRLKRSGSLTMRVRRHVLVLEIEYDDASKHCRRCRHLANRALAYPKRNHGHDSRP